MKKKCCGKWNKKDTYCKNCPLKKEEGQDCSNKEDDCLECTRDYKKSDDMKHDDKGSKKDKKEQEKKQKKKKDKDKKKLKKDKKKKEKERIKKQKKKKNKK